MRPTVAAMTTPTYEPLRTLIADEWIRGHVAPYRRYFVQILIIMSATIAINFTIPLTNRAVVNHGILLGDLGFVDMMMALQIAMYLSLIVLNAVRAKISGHVSNRLVTRMTSAHVTELLGLPMSFFHAARSGEFVERVRDLDRIQRFAAVEALDALTASVSILSLGVLLLVVDAGVFAIFAGSAMCYLGWIHLVGQTRRRIDAARFREGARARALEIGMVEAIQDIRIAGYEHATLDGWARVQLVDLRARLRATAIEQLQATGGHFFTRAGMVLVTVLAAHQTVAGDITLGDFTITSVIIVQLYFHLNQLLAFANRLEEVRAALHRTREIRRLHDAAAVAAARAVPPRRWSPIRLEGVALTYPDGRRASIVDLSLTVPPGEMTALVGPSGSGKSSVLKLLLRLYAPSAGTILVDGLPLDAIDSAAWCRGIGAVLQDGALFAASLRDNIVADRAEDAAWFAQVIEAARLRDVVDACDHGVDTVLGPGGARLSAGQAQRVLIARALYKRPHLLLLDEATSALDGDNEAAIVANIHTLLPGLTSVVAAHRLGTIARADQIVSLEGGRVVGIARPSGGATP